MRIAIVGAGGIGGYVGARLAEAGEDVTLIARGQHLAAIRADGLRVESPLGNAHVRPRLATETPAEAAPADVILFTVKLPDLDAAARAARPMAHAGTRIVALQNGVDARGILSAHYPAESIAQGVIYLAAYITAPGVIGTPGGKHQMIVDSLGGDAVLGAFFDAIDRAVALDVVRDAQSEVTLWQKFTAQASIAAVTALTRLPLGGVFASPEATALLRQLIEEAVKVATASGIALPPDHAAGALALYRQQPGAQSSSLLVDIEAGKPTELAWLSGRVHALGVALGVPTPAHSTAWHALAPYRDGPPARLV